MIEPAVIPQTIRIPKAPKKGTLVLFTTPQARVNLAPKFGRNQAAIGKNADGKGVCLFPNLAPGSYEMRITGDDYQPLIDTILIEKDRPTGLNGTLVSKFGTLMIALPGQEVSGVVVRLNGEPLASSRLKLEGDTIRIARIVVGKHQLALSLPRHDNWSQEIEVKPGEVAENKISAVMRFATVALTVKTLPQAEIYLDDLLRGRIGNQGMLRIPDLAPGTYNLKIKLAGYQTAERQLSLASERREVTEVVDLTSILETGEFSEKFSREIKSWTPQPPEWKLVTGNQRGLQIAGDAVAFVNNTSIPNLPFNQYGDFLLTLNVKLLNGKGASWVVRAQDERNYYLFELRAAQEQNQGKAWNFYVCRDGILTLKDTQPVIAEIGKPDTFVRISLEARENSFTLRILDQGNRGQGPTFFDNTFRYGGIGLRAINGLEMFITELFILPRN